MVTHLAQVAAFADRHFAVVKSDDGQVTTSGVDGRRAGPSGRRAGPDDGRHGEFRQRPRPRGRTAAGGGPLRRTASATSGLARGATAGGWAGLGGFHISAPPARGFVMPALSRYLCSARLVGCGDTGVRRDDGVGRRGPAESSGAGSDCETPARRFATAASGALWWNSVGNGSDHQAPFVTGGVASSLGKGLTARSLGSLLDARGLRVTMQKLDPYLNVDPGHHEPVSAR